MLPKEGPYKPFYTNNLPKIHNEYYINYLKNLTFFNDYSSNKTTGGKLLSTDLDNDNRCNRTPFELQPSYYGNSLHNFYSNINSMRSVLNNRTCHNHLLLENLSSNNALKLHNTNHYLQYKTVFADKLKSQINNNLFLPKNNFFCNNFNPLMVKNIDHNVYKRFELLNKTNNFYKHNLAFCNPRYNSLNQNNYLLQKSHEKTIENGSQNLVLKELKPNNVKVMLGEGNEMKSKDSMKLNEIFDFSIDNTGDDDENKNEEDAKKEKNPIEEINCEEPLNNEIRLKIINTQANDGFVISKTADNFHNIIEPTDSHLSGQTPQTLDERTQNPSLKLPTSLKLSPRSTSSLSPSLFSPSSLPPSSSSSSSSSLLPSITTSSSYLPNNVSFFLNLPRLFENTNRSDNNRHFDAGREKDYIKHCGNYAWIIFSTSYDGFVFI